MAVSDEPQASVPDLLQAYWLGHLHDTLKAEMLFGPKTRTEALAEAAKWRRRAKRYWFRWWRRRELRRMADYWERRAAELPESVEPKIVRWHMAIDPAWKEKT
jgi:hypothetical protein